MNSLIIAQNIIKRVFKSPKEIIALILLPVILIIALTFAVSSSASSKTPVGVVNLDSGRLAGKLVSYVQEQENYSLVKLNESNYVKSIQDKTTKAAVVIPAGFSKDIEAGKKVDIRFYSISRDLSTETLKQALNGYVSVLYQVSEATRLAGAGKNQQSAFDSLLQEVETRQLSSQYRVAGKTSGSSDAETKIPSVGFGIMFMMVLIFTTIGTILEDKKKLTLARMYVSPVNEWEIILGNILGSLALGVIQLIPLVAVYAYVFHLSSPAETAGLAITLFCFLVSTIGLGIGVSGIIKRDFNPTTMIAVIITPSSILGGCFIPESMMPDLMSKIGYIVPQKWVMLAIRRILEGSGLQSILVDLAVVLMFGLAFATFGLKTIRPLND